MRTERSILIAFILNLLFSIFEFIGGVVTGSVAIVSDAVHDAGDAASIGVSYFLEKKSRQRPDDRYTYGYVRYSIMGGLITTLILLVSSVVMIYNAVGRMFSPAEINYNGMIVFAVVGVCVNSCAAFFTREGDSVNQKAVNLHMFEDVLGWITVLIGAVVMRFTDTVLIDPLMSIGVSVFIFINAVKNLKEIVNLFLVKTPDNLAVETLKQQLEGIDGVREVYHIHLWSIDGVHHCATLHMVVQPDAQSIKESVRALLQEHGVIHVTIEIDSESCERKDCEIAVHSLSVHNGHHH